MASVFATEQQYQGSISPDMVKVQLGGESVEGMIFQNIQFSFSQRVTMLYEIGSAFVYYVGGRAQGTMAIGRVIGPSEGSIDFITKYGNICEPDDIKFSASGSCGPTSSASQGVDYTLKNAVLTTVGVSVNANDIIVNENLQLLFTDMDAQGG